jgi:hypothetical protein
MILTTLLLATLVPALIPDDQPASLSDGVTIPLVCDAQNGLTVPVSVHGAPPRPFLLDTGASITTIDDRTATALALGGAGRIPSGAGTDPLVSARLTVGPAELPVRPVAIADVRELAALVGDVGGILGSDALRAMGHATIDYERCTLIAGGTIDADLPARAVRVPLEWHQGRPVVAIAGGGRLLLDSGATTVSIFKGSRAAASLRWSSGAASLVRIERTDGVRVGFLGRLACLTIGRIDLRDVPAVAVRSWYDGGDTLAPDGLLPLALFRRVQLVYGGGYAVLVPRPARD